MSVMGIRPHLQGVISLFLILSCVQEEPANTIDAPQASPLMVVRPKIETLTPEQRAELGFPNQIFEDIEKAAGAEAEPFFERVEVASQNLRGEQGIERKRLAGFSVRTAKAEDILAAFYRPLRAKGFLLFRSRHNYGSVPDVLTVIRGRSSYDILKIQRTEAPAYKLETKAIIAWLKRRQRESSFVITGGGHDFVEARFIRQPRNMEAFARKVIAFAPDVRREGPSTPDRLADQMKMANGFRLVWD